VPSIAECCEYQTQNLIPAFVRSFVHFTKKSAVLKVLTVLGCALHIKSCALRDKDALPLKHDIDLSASTHEAASSCSSRTLPPTLLKRIPSFTLHAFVVGA
jgi:hypothetical protein